MSLTVSELSGLVSTTLSRLGRGKVTDIASDLQEYLAMSKLLRDESVEFRSGESIKFNLTSSLGSNARDVGLYETDNVDVDDSHIQGEVPWRFAETSYAFDTRENQLNTGDPVEIVNLIKLRKAREMAGLSDHMETRFWTKPSSSTDDKRPFGIPYWVVKSSGKTALADCDFNGGDPSGFSSGAAGLATATYGNWKNWAGNYTNVDKADLIKKMRKAARNINFKSPLKHPSYDTSPTSEKYQIYVNETTIADLEDVGESQNENLGRDLDPMGGMMAFKKNPVIYVPYLDSDSSDPVYFINWGVFKIACLKGEWLRETVKTAPNAHNVVNVFVDLAWNSICYDRRKLAVLST